MAIHASKTVAKRDPFWTHFDLFSADFVLILKFLVLLAVVIREQKEGFGSRFTTARRTGDFRMRPKSPKISRKETKMSPKWVLFGDVF